MRELIIFTLLTAFSSSLYSGEPDPLFSSEEVIRMELRSDFTAIQKSRAENQEYIPGELLYYNPDGSSVSLQVRVSARGNFRLKPENCAFPPLSVDFRKEGVKNTLFEKQDRLKLVTPCQGEQDVIEEYLIYKLYNQVTAYSFRVRLVKMLYFDTGKNGRIFEWYSFFLESKERMAERNDAVVNDKFHTPFDIDHESYKRLSVFQYIIGNKDWYVTSRKNIVIIQPDDTLMKPVAVPYDFDFSGLVNAFYSKPKDIPNQTVSYRRGFKGICYTEKELKEVIGYFHKLKPVFRAIIKDEKALDAKSRSEVLDYLNYSYTLLGNGAVRKQFLEVCETKEDYNIK